MYKTCTSCREKFWTEYSWATLCKPCYISEKKNETADLKEAAEYWESRALEAEGKLAKSATIDPEMLRRLIQLCHPDRHDNSESSQKATHWLLSHRR